VSPTISATPTPSPTPTPGCPDSVAFAESTVYGTLTNNFLSTQTSDGIYETITEVQVTIPYYAEQKWQFNISAGAPKTFHVEAFIATSDGENFIFAYSTDDVTYTDMLTISKTADDNTDQTFALPAGLSGVVYVRVRDANRNFTDGVTATKLSIDHMFIRWESTCPTPINSPSPGPTASATPAVPTPTQTASPTVTATASPTATSGTTPTPTPSPSPTVLALNPARSWEIYN